MTFCPKCKKSIQCGPPPTLHNQRFRIIRKLIKPLWDEYFETCTKEQKKELKKKILSVPTSKDSAYSLSLELLINPKFDKHGRFLFLSKDRKPADQIS